MVVLRKPVKPDYTVPGAHWPIALLNTIAKILSACVVEDLTQMAETHGLLLANHFGCQPGRTTTDSLHYVTIFVKDSWRKRRGGQHTIPGHKECVPKCCAEAAHA